MDDGGKADENNRTSETRNSWKREQIHEFIHFNHFLFRSFRHLWSRRRKYAGKRNAFFAPPLSTHHRHGRFLWLVENRMISKSSTLFDPLLHETNEPVSRSKRWWLGKGKRAKRRKIFCRLKQVDWQNTAHYALHMFTENAFSHIWGEKAKRRRIMKRFESIFSFFHWLTSSPVFDLW